MNAHQFQEFYNEHHWIATIELKEWKKALDHQSNNGEKRNTKTRLIYD
jgi:hypothetical protein